MKKLILAGTLVAALAGAGVASASSVTVVDPSPTGTFSGSYTYSCPTATNPNQTCTANQNGYVQVNSGGAVACNGNPTTLNGPEGTGQGEIWIGPGNAPAPGGTIVGAAPGNAFGAGNNPTSASQGPCNQNPSSTGVSP